MTSRWPRLLVVYGLIAIAVATILFVVGTSVAPCLGGATASCIAEWRAQRSVVEKLVEAYGVGPIALATFVALIGATLGQNPLLQKRLASGKVLRSSTLVAGP